jgi:hypothetical protein
VVEPEKTKSASDPPPWVPLLRRLTQMSPLWGVWKNADAALSGEGDIDSVSSPLDRNSLMAEFFTWASANQMYPIFVCHHLPGSVLGVAVRDRAELVELQLCEQAMFRGSTLFTAEDLGPMMMMDERGFRRLRSGAEGFLLLFHNAMKRGGRPALGGAKARRLVDLMREDPSGMEAAAEVFGRVRHQALRVARMLLDGGWERAAALRVELWAVAQARRTPRLSAARVGYQLAGNLYCPLRPVLRAGRRLTGDADQWLRRVEISHPTVPFASQGSYGG